MVAFEDSQQLLLYENVSDAAGVSFVATAVEAIPYGPPGTVLGMQAGPSTGDADNDADLDVLVFAPGGSLGSDRIHTALNEHQQTDGPQIADLGPGPRAGVYQHEVREDATEGVIRFEFEAPLSSEFQNPHLAVSMWRQTPSEDFDDPVEAHDGSAQFTTLTDVNNGAWVYLWENGGNVETEWMYYFELRLVNLHAQTGEVLAAGPASLYWFSSDEGHILWKLESQGLQEGDELPMWAHDWEGQVVHATPGGREIVPGVGGQEEIDLPPFNP